MPNLHAHVERSATDCDGRLDQSYVVEMNDVEHASDFGDIEFHDRVVAMFVNTYSLLSEGVLRVKRYGVATHEVGFDWSEPTEEGAVNVDVKFCRDDCNLDHYRQRDHFAERMGY